MTTFPPQRRLGIDAARSAFGRSRLTWPGTLHSLMRAGRLMSLLALLLALAPASSFLGAAPVALAASLPPATLAGAVTIGLGAGANGLAVEKTFGRYIATANTGANTISVVPVGSDGVLGHSDVGAGGAGVKTYTVGSTPSAVAFGNLLADNFPDIVVANSGDNTVTVLLSCYDTSCTPFDPSAWGGAATYSVGGSPSALAVVDLNSDVNPDIVTANSANNSVSVLLNCGTSTTTPCSTSGTFPTATTYPVGHAPSAVAMADLNHDGYPDIITANKSDNTVSVLLNCGTNTTTPCAGKGTFEAATTYAVGHGPSSVAVADLGNGQQDIVTANSTDNTVSVLIGNGDGTFHTADAAHTFAVGSSPSSVAIGDVNGDGFPDIVAANSGDHTVSVLLGNGDGTFTPNSPASFSVGVGAGCGSGCSAPLTVALVSFDGDSYPDVITGNGADNTVSALDNTTGRPSGKVGWSIISTLDTPREAPAGASSPCTAPATGATCLYAIGGYGSHDFYHPFGSVEMYDPTAAIPQWSPVASLQTARYGAAATSGPCTPAATGGTCIYVIGGVDGNFDTLNSVEMYNPATKSWTSSGSNPSTCASTAPGCLQTARSYPGAASGPCTGAVSKTCLYAIGGQDASGNVLKTVEMYDPSAASPQWTTLAASLQTGRYELAATSGPCTGAVSKMCLYAVAGTSPTGAALSSVETFDPSAANPAWSFSAPLNAARQGLAAVSGPCSTGSTGPACLYALGGLDNNNNRTIVEFYNPGATSPSWTTVASMPADQELLAAAAGPCTSPASGNCLYTMGGGSNGDSDGVAMYEPGQTTTITLTSSSSHNTSTYGDSVTFTATVSPVSAGTVTFSEGPYTLAQVTTDSNGEATYQTTSLHAYQHVIMATFAANDPTTVGSDVQLTQTVNPAPLSVSLTQSGQYGTAPNLSQLTPSNSAIHYSGFVNGDQPTSIGGNLTCSTTATSSSSVSGNPYTISNCSGLSSTDYAITYDYTDSSYSVTQAPLTITVLASGPYGSAPALSGLDPSNSAIHYATFVNSDTAAGAITGTLTCSTTATSSSSVGSYPIANASCSGLSAANYALTYDYPDSSYSVLPKVTSLSPTSAQVTGSNGSFALAVKGAGFDSDDTVIWPCCGGSPATLTQNASSTSTELDVTVPAADIPSSVNGPVVELVTVHDPAATLDSVVQPFYFTAANVSTTATGGTNTTPGGTAAASVGGSSGATGSFAASASGIGTLSIAQFSANPVTVTPPSSVSKFADVHLSPGNQFTSVSIVDCNLNANAQISWYSPTTSTWQPVAASQLTSGSPNANCDTITVTGSSTSPGLSDLTGTAFVTWATAPSSATSLAASPLNNTVTVTWSPPASNGGAAITSYTVTLDDGNSLDKQTQTITNLNSLSATFSGLVPNQAYTASVVATNNVGSGSAATKSVTTGLPAISIAAGWTLLTIPLATSPTMITDAASLIANMNGNGYTGTVKAVATYSAGRFSVFVPSYSASLPLSVGQGVFVLGSKNGAWAPQGALYATGQQVTLTPGWNLVGAPFPTRGLEGTAIDQQLGTQCGMQEIATYGGGGYSTFVHTSTASFHVPEWSGMWIECTSTYAWTPST